MHPELQEKIIGALIAGLLTHGLAIIYAILRLHSTASKVERAFLFLGKEHELIVKWYCEVHNMKIEDLPTRLPEASFWKP